MRSCSDRLASRFSVILLFNGESPLGRSSALELSMLGLVSVMSSLLAVGGHGSGSSRSSKDTSHPDDKEPWAGRVLALRLKPKTNGGAASKAFQSFFPAPRDLRLGNGLLLLGACCGHSGSSKKKL